MSDVQQKTQNSYICRDFDNSFFRGDVKLPFEKFFEAEFLQYEKIESEIFRNIEETKQHSSVLNYDHVENKSVSNSEDKNIYLHKECDEAKVALKAENMELRAELEKLKSIDILQVISQKIDDLKKDIFSIKEREASSLMQICNQIAMTFFYATINDNSKEIIEKFVLECFKNIASVGFLEVKVPVGMAINVQKVLDESNLSSQFKVEEDSKLGTNDFLLKWNNGSCEFVIEEYLKKIDEVLKCELRINLK